MFFLIPVYFYEKINLCSFNQHGLNWRFSSVFLGQGVIGCNLIYCVLLSRRLGYGSVRVKL